jgi:hypothetical protein
MGATFEVFSFLQGLDADIGVPGEIAQPIGRSR